MSGLPLLRDPLSLSYNLCFIYRFFGGLDVLLGVDIQIGLASDRVYSISIDLAGNTVVRLHVALLLLELYMLVFLLKLAVLQVILQHLLHIHLSLL
jgi:hypothetical protein